MSLSWCYMPNGYTFALENMRSIKKNGVSLRFTGLDGSVFDYLAGTVENAIALSGSINAAMATPAAFTVIGGVAPTWSGITPNTTTINQTFAGTIAGTGFLAAGINYLKFDDGAGHVFNGLFMNIESDTEIEFDNDGNIVFTVAATYTLYFSTDSGSTYTTTGLTVTAS